MAYSFTSPVPLSPSSCLGLTKARRCNSPHGAISASTIAGDSTVKHVTKAVRHHAVEEAAASMNGTETAGRGVYAAMAAAGLATALLAAPGPVLAGEALISAATEELQQSSVQSLASQNATMSLLPAEAPALVSESAGMLLGGVKDVVAGSLQGIATNSMTAVGGPVAGQVLSTTPDSSSNPATAVPTSEAEQPGSAPTTAVLPLPTPVPTLAEPAASSSVTPAVAGPVYHAAPCNLWEAYCHALQASPLPTKMCTGIVGTFLGDLAAQLLTHIQVSKQKSSSSSKYSATSSSMLAGFRFDVTRSARLCLYSAVIGTPMGHYEYEILEKVVMPSAPTSPVAVLAKVCLDQLVQTPFGMALFFSVMKMMEGKPGEVQQELQSKLVPGLLANWKLWPAAQLINFTVIPTEQRILFGNIVGVCWTCIISNMQQSSNSATASSLVDTAAHGRSVAADGGRVASRPTTPMPA